MKLDKIDKKLINILQIDSKTTTKKLANELNLSVTAIYERIKKLEKKGVIKKYVAVINREKIQRDFIVFTQVKLVQHHHQYIEKFEKEVLQFNEVLECYNISGDYDYFLKVAVENMKSYRNFINFKLTTLNHISSTHSTFIIDEVRNSSAILL
jgi:Lrp/AsnC family leucine-responsive transcriptional regulator